MKQKQCMLKWVFYASLALNLFFIGAYATGLFEQYQPKKLPPERLYEALVVLNEQDQAKVRAILDRHTPTVYENFAGMLKQFMGLRNTVQSEKFKYDEAKTFIEAMHKHHYQVTTNLLTIINEVSEAVDSESRIRFFGTAMPDSPHFIDKQSLKAIMNGNIKH